MARIQIRRGLASDWTIVNPILGSGELGLETDTGKIKVGNGSVNWNALGYYDKYKAPLDSPVFTGIPTVPTAAPSTNNLQIASTAYTDAAIVAGNAASASAAAEVIIAPAASTRNVITPTSAAVVPLTVKGAVGQTANLQEWKNGAGILVGKVAATGDLRISGDAANFSGVEITASGVGARLAAYVGYGLIFEAGYPGTINDFGVAVQAQDAARVGLIVRGLAAQTANLQEWQNSTGAVLASVSAAGLLAVTGGMGMTAAASSPGPTAIWRYTDNNLYYDNLVTATHLFRGFTNEGLMTLAPPGFTSHKAAVLTTSVATSVPAVVKGADAQTANLQEWQNSAGGVLTAVNSDGSLVVAGTGRAVVGINAPAAQILGTGIGIGGGQLGVRPASSGVAGVIVQGVAAQTANLQEWQDSTGAVKARIEAAGNLTLENGLGVNAKDIGGTPRRMFFMDAANNYGARNEAGSGSAYYGTTDPANTTGRAYFSIAGAVALSVGSGTTGLNGNAPVAKAAAIASPTSDTVGTKAAIDAIRVALTAIGITL